MSKTTEVKIEPGWKKALEKEFEKPYFHEIKAVLSKELKEGTKIYPPGPQIFNAFNTTAFDKVKVIIIGQDPYHGPNQAMGLSFSVPKGVPAPPSLKNIFREIKTDLNIDPPNHGDLTKWAEQGVFLLNASLTVQAHKANSHKSIGWHKFTDAVIEVLSEKRENLIFLLWGGFAKKKANLIDELSHNILQCGHPSPLSANKGHWFGNQHFSKTNEILAKQKQTPIDWSL